MNEKDIENRGVPNAERVQHVEALFLKHNMTQARLVNEWVPAWSSTSLSQTVKTILRESGCTVKELFLGLWNLLAHTNAPLTSQVAEFLFAIMRSALVNRYPREWQREDYEWMVTELKKGSTAAQAYLAILELSEEQLATCEEEILLTMRDSEFLHRALHTSGITSPDVLPHGHYKIQPLEIQSRLANGVYYGYSWGAILGTVTIDNEESKKVSTYNPFISAPSNWQELIQEYLGPEE
jgi:hypothetical protein